MSIQGFAYINALSVNRFLGALVDGAWIEQTSSLWVAFLVFSDLGLPPANLDHEPADGRHDDEVVVDASADKEDEIADGLQRLKLLPADGEGEDPDEYGAHAVEHHPGCSAHRLSDGEAGEIKERNTDDEPKRGDEE